MSVKRASEQDSEAKRILEQGYDSSLEWKIDVYYQLMFMVFMEDRLEKTMPATSKVQLAAVVQRVNELRMAGIRGEELKRIFLGSSMPLVEKNFPVQARLSRVTDPFFAQRYAQGTLLEVLLFVEQQSGNGLPDVMSKGESPQERELALVEGTRLAAQRAVNAGSQFRLPG